MTPTPVVDLESPNLDVLAEDCASDTIVDETSTSAARASGVRCVVRFRPFTVKLEGSRNSHLPSPAQASLHLTQCGRVERQ
jgi:hypothetical protein